MDEQTNGFGIQTLYAPNDSIYSSGGEKSSHFMELGINSSSLLLSSNTLISRETCHLAQFTFWLSVSGKWGRSGDPPSGFVYPLSLSHTHTRTSLVLVKCNQTLTILTNTAKIPTGTLSNKPHVVAAQGGSDIYCIRRWPVCMRLGRAAVRGSPASS